MSDEGTARAIRGLTVAIWALALVLAIGSVAPFIWSVAYGPRSMEAPISSSTSSTPSSAVNSPLRDEYDGFHQWPIEKKIASASAIIITKHRADGTKPISTVSEILLLRPGTTFYYKVGDEYRPAYKELDGNKLYGDGEIIFFTGSPAEMRYSATYAGDRCPVLGDMPMEALKTLVATGRGGT